MVAWGLFNIAEDPGGATTEWGTTPMQEPGSQVAVPAGGTTTTDGGGMFISVALPDTVRAAIATDEEPPGTVYFTFAYVDESHLPCVRAVYPRTVDHDACFLCREGSILPIRDLRRASCSSVFYYWDQTSSATSRATYCLIPCLLPILHSPSPRSSFQFLRSRDRSSGAALRFSTRPSPIC